MLAMLVRTRNQRRRSQRQQLCPSQRQSKTRKRRSHSPQRSRFLHCSRSRSVAIHSRRQSHPLPSACKLCRRCQGSTEQARGHDQYARPLSSGLAWRSLPTALHRMITEPRELAHITDARHWNTPYSMRHGIHTNGDLVSHSLTLRPLPKPNSRSRLSLSTTTWEQIF